MKIGREFIWPTSGAPMYFYENIVVICRKDESWGYPSIGQELSEKKNSMFFSVFEYDELEDK